MTEEKDKFILDGGLMGTRVLCKVMCSFLMVNASIFDFSGQAGQEIRLWKGSESEPSGGWGAGDRWPVGNSEG